MSSIHLKGLAVTGVLALALAAGGVHAQPGGAAAAAQPAAQPATEIEPELMVRRDPQGKVIPLPGNVDLMALKLNPFVTAGDWEALKPAILEWQADVDRQVIDNVDFMVQFDEGLIDDMDWTDQNKMREATEMLTQVAAPGPLTGVLQNKGLLSAQQSQAAMRLIGDYQQAQMNDIIMTEAPDEEGRAKQANDVSRFLFEMSVEDAMRSYRRQLDTAAGQIQAVLGRLSLSGDLASKVEAPAKAAAAATTTEARLDAMRQIMRALPLNEQRALLLASYELAGPHDPTVNLPGLPEGAKSTPAPRPTPAAAAPKPAAPKFDPAAATGNFTTPGGVKVEDLVVGTGETVLPGATVTIHYRGTLMDGTEFDSSYGRGEKATFPLNRLIKGWQEGIPGMKIGGKRKLTIPYQLAYGERGSPPKIPAKADLVFEIEIFEVKNP